jgi:aryl-alcohol dehydrogenase-like predicted oxidoreductase
MEYRQIGKWGLRVSEIGLGSWLTYGGEVSEEESIAQMQAAYDLGVNFFDTANVYARGRSEEVVGRAISSYRRESIVLATKVYFPMDSGPNDRGLSRKHIFEQCHLSLKRLKTDYIDLYQCHRYDSTVQLFEVVRAMDDLTRQGKILYWGVSEWSGEQIEAVSRLASELGMMPPISNQPQYNMLNRQIEASVLPVSKQLGLGQLIFSPLAQGVLTGKYKPGAAPPSDSRAANERVNGFIGRHLTDANLRCVERLSPIARELKLSMSQLALAWILRLPEVSSVITGATKMAQVEENVGASGQLLSKEVIAKIEDILASQVVV